MRIVCRIVAVFAALFMVANVSVTLAQWKATNGPYGGTINEITGNGLGTLYAAATGGLYRSTDSGQSWARVNVGIWSGGQATQVYAVEAVDSLIYVSTGVNLFKSTDDGSSWELGVYSTSGPPTKLVVDGFDIAMSEGNQAAVLANDSSLATYGYASGFLQINDITNSTSIQGLALSGGIAVAGTNKGVYVSSDTGRVWMRLDAGLTDTNITAAAINGNRIFLGTQSAGVFFSADSGQTWSACNSGLNALSISALSFNGSDIYAGTDDGEVYLSTNDGSSWTKDGSGLPRSPISSFYFEGNTVMVGTEGPGVFMLNGSWVPMNNGLQASSVSSVVTIGSKLFAATKGGGIYVSADSGSNWTAIDNGLTNLDVNALVADGDSLYAGTYGGGVFMSGDYGADWITLNTGLVHQYINALAATGNVLLAGTYLPPDAPKAFFSPSSAWADSGVVYLSTDRGNTWAEADSGFYWINAVGIAGSDLLASGIVGVDRSSDGGKTWTFVDSGLTQPYPSVSPVEVEALSSIYGNVFAGTHSLGVFVSTDYGTSWKDVNSVFFDGTRSFAASFDVSSIIGVNGIIYSAGNVGNAGVGVFYSADGESHLYSTGNGLTLPSFGAATLPVNALASGGDRLYAGTNGFGVWSAPLINAKAMPYMVVSNLDSSFFAGPGHSDSRTVYVTDRSVTPLVIDSARTLTKFYQLSGLSLPDTVTHSDTASFSIVFLPDSANSYADTLYLFTNEPPSPAKFALAGVGYVPTGVALSGSNVPTRYELYQNYPNPFNPATVIKFDVPSSGFVSLKVYDVLGRLVRTLVDRAESPGSYEVEFNAADLPSGVYFYRLRAGNFTKTMKLMVLK